MLSQNISLGVHASTTGLFWYMTPILDLQLRSIHISSKCRTKRTTTNHFGVQSVLNYGLDFCCTLFGYRDSVMGISQFSPHIATPNASNGKMH